MRRAALTAVMFPIGRSAAADEEDLGGVWGGGRLGAVWGRVWRRLGDRGGACWFGEDVSLQGARFYTILTGSHTSPHTVSHCSSHVGL